MVTPNFSDPFEPYREMMNLVARPAMDAYLHARQQLDMATEPILNAQLDVLDQLRTHIKVSFEPVLAAQREISNMLGDRILGVIKSLDAINLPMLEAIDIHPLQRILQTQPEPAYQEVEPSAAALDEIRALVEELRAGLRTLSETFSRLLKLHQKDSTARQVVVGLLVCLIWQLLTQVYGDSATRIYEKLFTHQSPVIQIENDGPKQQLTKPEYDDRAVGSTTPPL